MVQATDAQMGAFTPRMRGSTSVPPRRIRHRRFTPRVRDRPQTNVGNRPAVGGDRSYGFSSSELLIYVRSRFGGKGIRLVSLAVFTAVRRRGRAGWALELAR